MPHKMFLWISLLDTFQMKNPSDATLASLSILKYSKIQNGRQMVENIAKINIIHVHTGKCKSTGAGCNALVQSKLRTRVRLKWRKR